MIKETFAYSDYACQKRVPSRIAHGVEHWHDFAVGCPRCKRRNPPLQHDDYLVCQCGLTMQRRGNALICKLPEEMAEAEESTTGE